MIINQSKINKIKKHLMDDDILLNIAETFKTLGDKTRISILQALSKEELCVHELSSILGVSMSLISHQLRILRIKKLVKFRKEGKHVYYSLDDDHVEILLKMAFDHVTE